MDFVIKEENATKSLILLVFIAIAVSVSAFSQYLFSDCASGNPEFPNTVIKWSIAEDWSNGTSC